MKLTGLSLKLLTVLLTISRQMDLSSGEESRMWGKNTTMQRGLYRSKQFSFHFCSEVSLSTRNPLFVLIFSFTHSVMASAFLAPSKGIQTDLSFAPPGIMTMVGYPLSPKVWSNCLLTEASILATLAIPLRLVASLAHSGLRDLQWPHHGAYSSSIHVSSDEKMVSSKLSLSSTMTSSSEGPLQTSSSEWATATPRMRSSRSETNLGFIRVLVINNILAIDYSRDLCPSRLSDSQLTYWLPLPIQSQKL